MSKKDNELNNVNLYDKSVVRVMHRMEMPMRLRNGGGSNTPNNNALISRKRCLTFGEAARNPHKSLFPPSNSSNLRALPLT